MTGIRTRLKRVTVLASAAGLTFVLQRESTPDPLNVEDFLLLEEALFRDLVKSAEPATDQLRLQLLQDLNDANLTGLLGRHRLTRRITHSLGQYADALLEIAPEVAAKAQQKIAGETQNRVHEHWFPHAQQKLKESELLELEALHRHNALFMGTFLRETLPERAKRSILKAYNAAAGLSHTEKIRRLTSELKTSFGDLTDAPRGYWRTYAANALNNARTYAALRVFDSQSDQQVIAYRIKAAMDAQTTNICRALNGKVFPIKQALARFERLFQARTFAEVKTITPMVFGTAKTGFYTGSVSNSTPVDPENHQALIATGISFPPFHYRCRTTITPVYGVAAVVEDASDFEDQVLKAEFDFHFQRLADIDQAMEVFETYFVYKHGMPQSVDLKRLRNDVKVLSQRFRVEAKHFEDVLNYEGWLNKFEGYYKQALAFQGDTIVYDSDPKKNVEKLKIAYTTVQGALRGLRGRILEAQGAHWAIANKHQLLAFEFEIASNLLPLNRRNEPQGTDIDLLTYSGGATPTLNNLQFKFGKDAQSTALQDLRRQIALRALPIMKDPDVMKYTGLKMGFAPVKRQQKTYDSLNKYFNGDFPNQIRIIGFVSPNAITDAKHVISDIIIREFKPKSDDPPNMNRITVWLMRDIQQLNSDYHEYRRPDDLPGNP